jgi:hypothetical protein
VECGEGRRPVVDKERDEAYGIASAKHSGQSWSPTNNNQRDRVYRVEATITGYACACSQPTTRLDEPVGPEPGDTGFGWLATEMAKADEPPRPVLTSVAPLSDLPPTRPAVVLDPFGGTGTVAGVARQLGRIGISVDLSMGYSRLARWRVFESGHFTKSEQRTWADRQQAML